MKSTHIALISAFASAAFASPVQTLTITVVPVAAPSPYPAQPTTNEFKYVNYDEKNTNDVANRKKVHDAFTGDWTAVLQKAVESLADSNDKTFDRWFPPTVKRSGQKSTDARTYVSGVYKQLFSPDATTPTPKSVVATFVSDKNDYANLCPAKPGKTKPSTDAYFTRNKGTFHVCDKGLGYTTKASDIDCNSLGLSVSTAMESTTGVLIHEFHHSDEVGDKAPDSVGHIRDVEYGPSTCMRLRNGGSNQDTFVNADSYMWFALNAYYNKKCNKNFGDPVITTEDFEDGQDQLMASPEYDASLADGALAGV